MLWCLTLHLPLCSPGGARSQGCKKAVGVRGRDSSVPHKGWPPAGGNGTPLQCPCLGDPIDRGAWGATVHGVATSQTRLKLLNTQSPVRWRGIQAKLEDNVGTAEGDFWLGRFRLRCQRTSLEVLRIQGRTEELGGPQDLCQRQSLFLVSSYCHLLHYIHTR